MTEKPILAYINYKMLTYARRQAHMNMNVASDGILPIERLSNAELQGNEQDQWKITFEEFRQLADRYHKTITFFYLNKPPTFIQRYRWWVERRHKQAIRKLLKRWHLENNFTEEP